MSIWSRDIGGIGGGGGVGGGGGGGGDTGSARGSGSPCPVSFPAQPCSALLYSTLLCSTLLCSAHPAQASGDVPIAAPRAPSIHSFIHSFIQLLNRNPLPDTCLGMPCGFPSYGAWHSTWPHSRTGIPHILPWHRPTIHNCPSHSHTSPFIHITASPPPHHHITT